MLVWRGPQVNAALLKDARRKVAECCLLVERDAKMSMRLGGRSVSGVLESKTFIGRGGKNVRRRVDSLTGERAKKINSFRSAPGEVPRVQTGTLRRSITHWFHPTLPIGRVGTNLFYAKYLEFGTRRMKPRPYMRPSLMRMVGPCKAIFEKPIDWGRIGA